MADKKFSEFTSKPSPDPTDELVGEGGGDNFRVPVSAFADGSQGAKADTAVQPGDDVSDLNNDAGYVTTSGITTVESDDVAQPLQDTINFEGTGVTVTPEAGKTTVTIDGGSGGVTSVNTDPGPHVILTTDDIDDTSTNRYTSQADANRLANTSGTNTGDNPGVTQVNGDSGPSVTLDTSDINPTTDRNYVTDAESTVIGNTSGTNTGDDPGYATVEGAGTPVTERDTINFTGAAVTVTDEGGKTRVDIQTGAPGGGYDTIEDEGTPITQESVMNFTGAGVTVTPGTGETTITIPGGSAGSGTVTEVTGDAPIVVTGDPNTTPNVTITAATTSAAGSLSAADKTKLDALSGTNTGDNPGVTQVNGDVGPSVTLTTDDVSDSAANRYTSDTDINRLAGTSGTNTGDNAGVTSVNADTGPSVVLTTDQIPDSATRRYTDDTDINRLANTSGTNTGDDPGYQAAEDDGTPVTVRDTLNFTGAGVTVTDEGGKTRVDIPASGGGGAVDSVSGTGAIDVTPTTGDTVVSVAASASGVTGTMSGAQYDKLDGIEAGATADQTPAEIKASYESNADTNAFKDSDSADLSAATAHVGTTTGNPHSVLYSELSDAPGTFTGPSPGLVPANTGSDPGDVLDRDGNWVANGSGGGSGTVRSGTNVGSGEGLIVDESDGVTNLDVKSVTAGRNITLNSSATEVEVVGDVSNMSEASWNWNDSSIGPTEDPGLGNMAGNLFLLEDMTYFRLSSTDADGNARSADYIVSVGDVLMLRNDTGGVKMARYNITGITPAGGNQFFGLTVEYVSGFGDPAAAERYDVSILAQNDTSLGEIKWLWSDTTSGDPGTGYMGSNAVDFADATRLRFSEIDAQGKVRDPSPLAVGDVVAAFDYDRDNWGRYTVTELAPLPVDSWYEIGVRWEGGSGNMPADELVDVTYGMQSASINNYALISGNVDIDADLGLVGTGQSNFGLGNPYIVQDPPEINPLVLDWSRGPTGLEPLAWRIPDPSEVYEHQRMINPYFDNQLGWSSDNANLVIDDVTTQTARCDTQPGTEATLSQTVSTVVDLQYSIAINVTTVTSGSYEFKVNGAVVLSSSTTLGEQKVEFVGSGSDSIEWVVTSDFVGACTTIAVNPTVYIGYPRSAATYSYGHAGYAAACELANRTGKVVRTCFASRVGTSIADPLYGWLYDAGGENVAGRLDTEAKASLAAWRAEPGQSGANYNYGIYMQGESDLGSNSTWFGFRLYEFISAVYDSSRYGWGVRGLLKWMLVPPNWQRDLQNGSIFHGMQIAQDMAGSETAMSVIDVSETTNRDPSHYTGESVDLIGRRMSLAILENITPKVFSGAPFRYRRFDLDMNEFYFPEYNYQAPTDGATSVLNWSMNLAGDELTVHTVGSSKQGFFNAEETGMVFFGSGVELTLEQTNTPSTTAKYLITGPVAFDEADGNWTWPCVLQSSSGTFTVGQAVNFSSSQRIFDGEDGVAHTDNYIESQKLEEGQEESGTDALSTQKRLAIINNTGVVQRVSTSAPLYATGTAQAGGAIVVFQTQANATGYAELSLIGINTSNSAREHYKVRFGFSSNATNVVIDYETALEILHSDDPNTPTISLTPSNLGIGIAVIDLTGAVDFNWTIEGPINYSVFTG